MSLGFSVHRLIMINAHADSLKSLYKELQEYNFLSLGDFKNYNQAIHTYDMMVRIRANPYDLIRQLKLACSAMYNTTDGMIDDANGGTLVGIFTAFLDSDIGGTTLGYNIQKKQQLSRIKDQIEMLFNSLNRLC